jgi:hypothetical protein
MAAVPHRLHGINGAEFLRRLFHELIQRKRPNPLGSNQDIWRLAFELWPFVSLAGESITAAELRPPAR